MPFRKILFPAAFTIVAWASVPAAVGELQSNDNLSSEPFRDLQPFDLSKRDGAPETDAQGKPQPKTVQAIQPITQNTNEILKVNDLGDPQRIKFEGVSLFPEEQLRLSLACDSIYQAAARPSNDTADLLATLEQRLTEGYRHTGCPDANVRAWRDREQNAIIVHVDEGKRVCKGRVIIKAPPPVDKKRLVESLTTEPRSRQWHVFYGLMELAAPEESTPLWQEGEGLSDTQKSRDDLNAAIRIALIEQGFPLATIRTSFQRSESSATADLELEIGGNLCACPITTIEVEGLKRDSRAQFLHYLGINESTLADGPAFDSLCAKLTHSCRYWSEKVTVDFPALPEDEHAIASTGAKLKIAVVEYSPMPPLDKPLEEVDEVLRKTGEALNETGPSASWGDAVFEADFENVQNSDAGFHIRSVFNIDHGVAFEIKTKSKSTWNLEHSFILRSDELAAVDWQAREKFQSGIMKAGQFQLSIKRSTNDNGEPAGCMMFGWVYGDKNATNIVNPRMWRIRVDPAEIVHTAHRPEYKTQIHDGVLKVSALDSEMDFDVPSGRFLGTHGTTTQGTQKTSFDLHFEQGAFENAVGDIQKRSDGIANYCDNEHVISSGANFLRRQLEKQPAIQNDPTLHRAFQLATFATGLSCCRELLQKSDINFAAAVLNKTGPSDPNDKTFTIPSSLPPAKDDVSKFVANVVQFVPLASDRTFPRGSWPWTLTREIAFSYLFNESKESTSLNMARGAREVDRNVTGGQMGPVGTYLFIKGLQTTFPRIGGSEYAAAIARMARNDLTDVAFAKDVSLVAGSESGLAMLCKDVTKELGKMPEDERQQLVACFPDCWHDPLERLIARRQSAPKEPADVSIKEALLESWHHGLKDAVELDLRSLSADVARSQGVSAAPEQFIDARAPHDRP